MSMKDSSLLANEFEGTWWLPSDEKTTLPGRLSFVNGEEGQLELRGSFKPINEIFKQPQYQLILGNARATKLTAIECQELASRFGTDALQRFHVPLVLIGCHLEDWAAHPWRSVELEVANLHEWLGGHGLDERITAQGDGTIDAYSLEYVAPDFAEYRGDAVVIGFSPFLRTRSAAAGSKSIRPGVRLRIEPSPPVDFPSLLEEYVVPVHDFLTLLIGRASSITDVRVSDDSDAQATLLFGWARLGSAPPRPISRPETLVPYASVEKDFGQVLQRWMESHKELSAACELYFTTKYGRDLGSENRFLQMIQAAEVIHRRRFTNEVIPKHDYSERMELVLENVPEEHRNWVREQLQFGNEPRLRHRLLDLVARSSEVISPLISSSAEFADRVVRTRNYLVHRDPGSKRRARTEKAELDHMSDVVGFLIETVLLTELGFEASESADWFRRRTRYREITLRKE